MKGSREFISLTTTTQDLSLILDCTTKLLFQGQESISRLKSLNRLAHEAALASLLHVMDEEDFAYAERQLTLMDCFVLNRHSLNGLEILTGQNSEKGFEKIKNRLLENIRFFIQEEKKSPMRQKSLMEV
jgi:hypothetical protein